MTDDARHYWKCLDERTCDPLFLETAAHEFVEPIPTERHPSMPPLSKGGTGGVDRRDFLAAAGFAFAGLTLSGCSQAPERHVLAHVVQPENATPGRALHYASTCFACPSGCGLLVKCRDGRPIKLEGNPEHGVSKGGLCAIGQASILGLYDRQRLQQPLKNGQPSTWQEVDGDIRSQLDTIRRQGGAVRVLSGTILSPTTRSLIQQFLSRFVGGRHVVYDPLSCSAILDAHERTHGVRALPHYRLDRAEVIVSFDADFLGTWISPVQFARAYHEGRSLAGETPRCSLHIQFESRLSLTGAKADQRHRVAPGELGLVMTHLTARLARLAGVTWPTPALAEPPLTSEQLDHLARQLWQARGRSIVLCGTQDIEQQILCNFLNQLLGNYGATVDLQRPSLQRQGNDAHLSRLLQDLNEGQVVALFVLDCNPVFDLPDSAAWTAALRRVPLLATCAERLDETAGLARYVCPHPHYLASWSDAEPIAGMVSLAQPTFPPLGNVRTVLESLSAWTGTAKSARQVLQEHWQANVFPRQTRHRPFQAFWDGTLHDGFAEIAPPRITLRSFDVGAVLSIAQAARPTEDHFDLVLYPKISLGDGRHAYNPWLQELPDPISKVSWDNYVCLSPATAERLHLREGDVLRIAAEGVDLELPAYLQPGQHDRVIAIALGYGSKLSERFAHIGPAWLEAQPTVGPSGLVGVNAASLLHWKDSTLQYGRHSVQVSKVQRHQPLACTQTHHSLSVPANLAPRGQARRPLILETTVAGLSRGVQPPGTSVPTEDLWPNDHPTRDHRWGMVIDLNACTGCSACVLACQVENNIPVVGKDEVRRQREMHWIRIDRYYQDSRSRGDFGSLPGDVDVAYQPMLCQHCGNAPCETVCPVLATVHSSEGLNQQVYNRCVGTRYCANNCPYKVRRFNWFDYPHEDALQNLVLNPDVTVRTRGVMEKCSFCVQRIQEAKIEARRPPNSPPSQGGAGGLADGAVQTACQQSCPAQAIHFGDLNDPTSKVARLQRDGRSYQVLAELNVQPAVHYLKVVRNRNAAEGGAHE